VFRRRNKEDTPGKLWGFMEAVRSGRDASGDAELRELFAVVRAVGSALSADPESGPEEQSREKLMALIAEDEVARQRMLVRVSVGRGWKLFAASGWATAVVLLALLTYQHGFVAGKRASEGAVANGRQQLAQAISAINQATAQMDQLRRSAGATDRHGPRPGKAMGPSHGSAGKPADAHDAGAVTADGTDESTPGVLVSETTEQAREQARLMREGYDRVLRRDWEGAVDSFERAAQVDPDGDSALDAYHAAALVCSGPLNDPRRAGAHYQKESKLARALLARQGREQSEQVRMRLARAYEAAGLAGGDRSLLTQAMDELAKAEASPPQSPTR
jgi:tetratricopeptide (TPR) repeat protein